jgi:hypothetical protein
VATKSVPSRKAVSRTAGIKNGGIKNGGIKNGVAVPSRRGHTPAMPDNQAAVRATAGVDPHVDAGVDAYVWAVERLIGEPVLAMTSLDGGSTSRTFAVTAHAGEFVAKINTGAVVQIARAAHNVRILAELGIPVPRVVGYDDSGQHVSGGVLVMTKLGGRELALELATMTRPQMTRLAELIMQMQARVATLPGSGGCWRCMKPCS